MSQDPVAKTIPLFDPNSDLARRALGSLIAELGGAKKELPLAGVDIEAKVADRISDVTVKQKFRNTFAEHLEAVYIFPLACSAVVTSFDLRVGTRKVMGVIKERQEARQDYQAALDAGKRSALMEQERDDIFTMQVGNIAPGEEVTVEIKYSERLPFFEDGTCEIRLPLVVAPRYISGTPKNGQSLGHGTESDTDEVPDASRITPPRLVPGANDNVQLSVSVELIQSSDASVQISDLNSSQHVIGTSLSDGGVKVELSQDDEVMDRDFILRWVAAEKKLKPKLISFSDSNGDTYCMLTVMSPKQEKFLGVPRDVIFIVDRSGSMSGSKMASAAKSCSILLDTLGPQDRFSILAFDNMNEWMQPHVEWSNGVDGRFVCADESGIESGKAYLRTITARGGTDLEPALAESLEELSKRKKKDASGIIVILTDGQVGNESVVFSRLQRELGDARVFTVGIDTAVNGGILTRMASLGGGTCALVTPGAKLEKALGQIGREIGVPILTGISLEATQGKIAEDSICPANMPDLFRGRAVTYFFKTSKGILAGKGKIKVRVKGKLADGSSYVEEVLERRVNIPAIASLYVKSRIRDLEDQFREDIGDRNFVRKTIINLSLQHSVLCRFTAFIAVDEVEVVNKDGSRRTVVQPVHQPKGWETDAADTAKEMFGGVGRLRQATSFFNAGKVGNAFGACPPPPPGSPAPRAESGPSPQSSSLNETTGSFGALNGGWGSAFGSSGNSLSHDVSFGASPDANQSWELPGGGLGMPNRGERGGIPNLPEAAGSAPSSTQLISTLKELIKLFTEATQPQGAQANSDRDIFEAIRKKCLLLLQQSKFAETSPRLQQFLRSEAIEFVAALKAGHVPEEVVERINIALPALQAEIEAIIHNRTPVVSVGNFWENTI